ncbi:MAG TPA: tetratricopeptide repeat protein, partial [Longimicrobiales bacterium]|nr:tetratricopeptide repeat protein [Longimicrobiales bacterium]
MRHLPFLLLTGLVLQGCGGDATAGDRTVERSTSSEASFVGSTVCADCHADVVELYATTNKSHSISRFDPERAPERFPSEVVYNAPTNLHYEALVRGDTLFQREFRLADDGRVVHEVMHPAAYVIGSGAATRSYLMKVNGYVTEMPLTWYSERAQWDMSPGYEEANDRFARKINLECATCHTDFPEQSRFTQNHYPELPTGIGCERCHGPAGDHVALRTAGEGPPAGSPDPTIVHPGRISRDAQLSICQQCHLAGVTVFKEGESPTTFRPGQSLYAHRTVFVPEQQLTDPNWVGIDSHPLRLARSVCYQASEMTCTTCHAPHTGGQTLEPAAYNESCVGCHADGGGGPDHSPAGDCVSCHMSRTGTSDVPHVRFTDHWIRRDPGPPLDPSEGRPAFESPQPINIVALQEEGRGAYILAERTTSTPLDDLETAAAYFHFYETMHRVPVYRRTVIDHARRGFAGGADHVEARIALGRALADLDSLAAAEQVLRDATRAYPADPWTHFWLGAILEEQGRPDAIDPLRRAVAIQPLFIEAQIKLADALVGAQRLDEALVQLEHVVSLDPVHAPRSWHNIGIIRMQRGDAEGAVRAFDEAARSDPDLVDAHVMAGTIRMNEGAFDAAETRFLAAVAADPEAIAGYGSLGVL